MMGNSGVGYPDDALQEEQEADATVSPREPAAEPMPSEQSAIRAAFLARQTEPASATAGGVGGEGSELEIVTLRSAYLKHLSDDRTEAVEIVEFASDTILRGVYAARAGAAAEPAVRPRRGARNAAKASPARKARKAKAARATPGRAKAKKTKAPARKLRAKAAASGRRAKKKGTARKTGAKKGRARGRGKR